MKIHRVVRSNISNVTNNLTQTATHVCLQKATHPSVEDSEDNNGKEKLLLEINLITIEKKKNVVPIYLLVI